MHMKSMKPVAFLSAALCASVACAVAEGVLPEGAFASRTAAARPEMRTVVVVPSVRLGPIKPVNGVNNAPIAPRAYQSSYIVKRIDVPFSQIALHLTCNEVDVSVALRTFGNVLNMAEGTFNQQSVVAEVDVALRIRHARRFLGKIVFLDNLERVVDVEFKVGHDSQLIPQFTLVVLLLAQFREHAVHHPDYSLGASLSFGSVLEREGIVDHSLDASSVFG